MGSLLEQETDMNSQLMRNVACLRRAYDFDPLKEAQAFQQAAPVAKREEAAPKPPQHVSCLLRIPSTGPAGRVSPSVLHRCGRSLCSAASVVAICMLSSSSHFQVF